MCTQFQESTRKRPRPGTVFGSFLISAAFIAMKFITLLLVFVPFVSGEGSSNSLQSSEQSLSVSDEHPARSSFEGQGNSTQLRRLQGAPFSILIPDTTDTDPLLRGLNIPSNAAEVGMWGPVISWPAIPIHAAVMPDGRLLTFGAPEGRDVQEGRVFVYWDQSKGTGRDSFSISPNAQGVDSFCASASLLQSGDVIVSGGINDARYTTILNYQTEVSRRDVDMKDQRYYGTMTKLADGRVMTTGGGTAYANTWASPFSARSIISSTPEVYRQGEGWTLLTGAFSIDAFGPDSNRWWYPRQWVTPRGSVFGISTEKVRSEKREALI